MIGASLNLAYLLVLVAASPWLACRALRTGKYREGWWQKFFGFAPRWRGRSPASRRRRASSAAANATAPSLPFAVAPLSFPRSPRLWFHAVSVGEVLALRRIIDHIDLEHPDWQCVVSTTTNTGMEMARRQFPDRLVFYWPLDFTWAVRRALDRVQPDVVALVELELWPNFIAEAARRGVRLALVNGRMSPRSFRGYRRLRYFVRWLLGHFDVLGVQDEGYASRFRALGAPGARVAVTGSVKYDGLQGERDNAATRALVEQLGIGDAETVLVAGSTLAPEEEIVLDAYEALLADHPGLRLVLVPRHKERFDEVAALLGRRGLPFARRSRLAGAALVPAGRPSDARLREGAGPLRQPVILLDTLGELAAMWGRADVAFVGGSLAARGGQNMIEPAAFGAAIVLGPHTWNFRETVRALIERQAARVVRSREELIAGLRELLASPDQAHAMGERARRFVLSQQGASARTVALLEPLVGLKRRPAQPSRRDDRKTHRWLRRAG